MVLRPISKAAAALVHGVVRSLLALGHVASIRLREVLRLRVIWSDDYFHNTPRDRRALPVLCFGDSLTEGYHGVWTHPAYSPAANPNGDEIASVRLRPYSIRLGHRLAGDVGDAGEGYKASLRYACVRAYSGWTAEELLPALRAALREQPWRAACILAGSNDIILAGEDAITARSRVERLHEACDAAGVPVVVLTNLDADLTHHGMVPADQAATRRHALEELATVLGRSGRPIADVRAALPLSAAHFDDCMHPSPEGARRARPAY